MRSSGVRERNLRHEDGVALLSVLMLSVLAVALTGALASVMWAGMGGTRLERSGEIARTSAEAGLNATLFKIEAATNPAAGPIAIETYLATALGAATVGQPRAGTRQFTGTLPGGSYVTTLSDPSAGDYFMTLSSVGTDAATRRTETLVAVVRAMPVDALNYAMFGNHIEFHNHNKVPYGLTLNTTIFSNGAILIDKAVSIVGLTQAVNTVSPNTGPASGTAALPNTTLTPTGEQGDPDPITTVPSALIAQVTPGPEIKPFPTFDFNLAQTTAAAAGRQMTPTQFLRLIANAQDCAVAMAADGTARLPGYAGAPAACLNGPVYAATGVTQANVPLEIVHYRTNTAGVTCPSSCPAPRSINVPNAANPTQSVPLGSANGVANAANNTDLHEIRLLGDGVLQNSMFYISGALTLTRPTTTLLQIQGGLIVNGAVTLNAPVELMAWRNRTAPNFVPLGQTLYETIASTAAETAEGQPFDVIYSNWPALAANGKLNIKDSGAFPDGGPVHIEGAVYTPSESHFHKSDAYESSYAVGSEIADTIHNCQWFSFAYDPQAKKTLGLFGSSAGRERLQVIRLEDR